jgi:hypothetical protein
VSFAKSRSLRAFLSRLSTWKSGCEFPIRSTLENSYAPRRALK